ncbi:MAG: MerR family transcriptional regulator [Agathobacter sp.]|nr:MerR family transcriptional regulator [Agathobacter sp.]
MEKVRYMISDAADMVHVETHVLRYWEEELELSIPRNEMGHRYYTRENIKEFQRIKDLKDQGYQLKAIRMILHNGKLEPVKDGSTDEWYVNTMDEDEKSSEIQNFSVLHGISSPIIQPKERVSALTPEERMAQFRELMSDIVGQAIAQNNDALSESIGKDVQERVLKEMNYLMREQDNAQEERYKKLDAAIRGSIRKRPFFVKKEKKEK